MEIGYIIEYGALISGIIGILAYIPQIMHLLKHKDSTGVSVWTWQLWFVCTLFPLIYAIYIRDFVFTVIYALALIFMMITIVLIYKYRKK